MQQNEYKIAAGSYDIHITLKTVAHSLSQIIFSNKNMQIVWQIENTIFNHVSTVNLKQHFVSDVLGKINNYEN